MARVLLAEKDDAVRELLHTALERDGFDVIAVPSVRRALRCIATEKFDVLLSDLHMPQPGDGFTLASAMRHTHPKAVTLVLTGHPELSDAISAIRSQADEVLVKPIEFTALGEIIREKLASRASHEALPAERVASIPDQSLDTIRGWMKPAERDEGVQPEIAKIEAEIDELEKALADCSDGDVRRVIRDWIAKSKQQLSNVA